MINTLTKDYFGSHLKTEIIRFETATKKLKAFNETKTINDSFFGNTAGATYIANGFAMAYDGIKDIDSKYKYVIALSDGAQSSESCTSSSSAYKCSTETNTIAKAAALLKKETDFTVIGYGKSTSLTRYNKEADRYYDLYQRER